MTRSVVFLEEENQLDVLLKTGCTNSQKIKCVAVFPRVYEKARQAGLAVRPLDDFGHVGSLASYNEVTIAKIEQLTSIFDPLWDTLTEGLNCARCVSFRAFFHPLKGYYDALVKRALPMRHALEQLHPTHVWIFPARYGVNGFSLLERPARGLTSLLAPLIAAHAQIPIVPIEMSDVASGFYIPSVPPSTVPFATACSLLVHAEQTDACPIKLEQNTLLTFTHILEELDGDFVSQLNRAGINVLSAYPPEAVTQIPAPVRRQLCQSVAHKATDDFFAQDGLAEQWIVDGIDFSSFLTPYLGAMLRTKLSDLLFLSYSAQLFYSRFEKSAMLSGGMSLERFVLTRAARRAGLRTINQHRGGMLGYAAIPTLERYDLAEAEFFFVNGKGAVENYAKPCAGTLWPEGYGRAKPVAVGAPWVWNIFKKCVRETVPQDRPLKICYLLEADVGDYGYMGSHVRPSFLNYETARSVVEIFSNYPDVDLFIKEYPVDRFKCGDDYISEHIRTLNAPNITILNSCSVASIADAFDVFILDYPGTPLMELASSGKTVILYADEESYSLHENAQKILAQCSCYFKTKKDFLEFINSFCMDSAILTRKTMTEFLSTFSLPSTVQSPSLNIMKFVKQIINI